MEKNMEHEMETTIQSLGLQVWGVIASRLDTQLLQTRPSNDAPQVLF